MSKRNLWKYDETMEMLSIMRANSYPRMFSNKHYKNMNIFRMVEEKMKLRGYKCKSGEQICVRWKNLKNLYRKVKQSNNKNEQELFPYYTEMDELIGHEDTTLSVDDTVNTDTSPIPSEVGENYKKEDCSTAARNSQSFRSDTLWQVPTNSINKWTRRVEGSRRPVSKLEATLASSKQELSDEFYRTQKRLIDYEFNLYMQKEEKLIGQIQESTKSMLDECMDRFFSQLQNVVGNQGHSAGLTLIGSYEDHLEEQ